MSFDAHLNFAVSLIAVAPIPAASGTTFNVTAGEGALFPAAPFNVVVWPAGANPTASNAEVLRVTSKGTGDNWTATRVQESSVARSIALGDQISAAITAKLLTDIEALVTTNSAAVTNVAVGRVPGGRLTLTTALSVTTSDVLAAGTLFYTPHIHNVISLYSGTAWADFTFPELSIAVPAVANQMYDVFVFDNAGTRTLELLAWTNDTTRATALVRQDGHWVKTGALTRLYVGSFRTTTVVSQTEDSSVKRYVWNMFNRVDRDLRRVETTASWTYTTNTYRQANGAAANQVDIVVGIAEVRLNLTLLAGAFSTVGANDAAVGIGEDSTTTVSPSSAGGAFLSPLTTLSQSPAVAVLGKYPAVGRHFYTWLEKSNNSASGNVVTFTGAPATGTAPNGLIGSIAG